MATNDPSPSLIKDILTCLKTIVLGIQKIETNPHYKNMIAQQLRDNGYDYFGERENSVIGADHVLKILALAINDAIKRKNSPKDRATAETPLDLAEYYNNEIEVENLIKNQFEIKWNTTSGQPKPFTYYQFCNKKGRTDLLKYNPRRENVFVQLYRECMAQQQKVYTLEELCPTVYVKAWPEGWRKWNAVENKIRNIDRNELEWMEEPIRRFALQNADEMLTLEATSTNDKVMKCLGKATVYWAVIDDTDFQNGDSLNLNNIGRTQVYVGKTKKGIRGRWLTESSSHTKMIKKCLDNANAMTTYDPLRLKGIQLVQARLALAKLRNENCALFLIKTFADNGLDAEEKRHINGEINLSGVNNNVSWKPNNMAYGMNN